MRRPTMNLMQVLEALRPVGCIGGATERIWRARRATSATGELILRRAGNDREISLRCQNAQGGRNFMSAADNQWRASDHRGREETRQVLASGSGDGRFYEGS